MTDNIELGRTVLKTMDALKIERDSALAREARLRDALCSFVYLYSRDDEGKDPIAGLHDSHLHELIWAADDDELDFDGGDKRIFPTITTGQLRRAREALKFKGE